MGAGVIPTGSLWEALTSVPDHQRAPGKRYSLASLLLIAIAALLAGRRDQLGIVRWGPRLSRDALISIGIDRARVPHPRCGANCSRDWTSPRWNRLLVDGSRG
jgi:hypothetical protein